MEQTANVAATTAAANLAREANLDPKQTEAVTAAATMVSGMLTDRYKKQVDLDRVAGAATQKAKDLFLS